jgi:hypothetical protein
MNADSLGNWYGMYAKGRQTMIVRNGKLVNTLEPAVNEEIVFISPTGDIISQQTDPTMSQIQYLLNNRIIRTVKLPYEKAKHYRLALINDFAPPSNDNGGQLPFQDKYADESNRERCAEGYTLEPSCHESCANDPICLQRCPCVPASEYTDGGTVSYTDLPSDVPK